MSCRIIVRTSLWGALLALLISGGKGATAASDLHSRPVEVRSPGHATALFYRLTAPGRLGPLGRTRELVNPLFRPLLPRLRGVDIPVALPTVIPRRTNDRLYAAVDEHSPFSYIIDLGYTATCHGVNYCRFGELDGGPVGDTPTIFDYPRSRQIRLRNGAPALYIPYSCGASCGDSVLVFQMQGAIYTITLKTGALKDLVAMANSVVTVAVQ